MQLKKVHEKESFGKHDTSIKSIFAFKFSIRQQNECRERTKKSRKNLLERVLRRKIKISRILLQFYSDFFLTLTSLTQVCIAGTPEVHTHTQTHTHSIR